MRSLGLRSFYKKGRHISSKSQISWQDAVAYGLYDASNLHFYRTDIDLGSASDILSTPNLLWDAFQYDLSQQTKTTSAQTHDVSKLETIVENADVFVSKGDLVDREELIPLKEIISKPIGSLVLYLGGMILIF